MYEVIYTGSWDGEKQTVIWQSDDSNNKSSCYAASHMADLRILTGQLITPNRIGTTYTLRRIISVCHYSSEVTRESPQIMCPLHVAEKG